MPRLFRIVFPASAALSLVLAACAPAAAPSPTAAEPAAATAPASKPADRPAAKPADTKAIEDFYKGKTVKIIVGFSPGGGFDTYARLIARHLSKHVPGTPNVVVENQTGAGSLLAANSVYNTAPKDGTTIVHFHGSQVVQQLLGNPAVEFDAQKYNWLGAPVPDTPACAVTKASGFTRLDEATESRQLILGGEAPGATTADIPNTLKSVLGLNIKLVGGYQGTSKIRLAADQGEVMGGCWGWSSIKVTWKDGLEKGDVLVIAQGGKTAHSGLPDVPLMRDLAKTEEQRQLIDAGITLSSEFARGFAVPPGTPAERVQTLRQAFLATLEDSEFLAEAEKGQLEISPISGEQIAQSIDELFGLSPETKAKLKSALSPS